MKWKKWKERFRNLQKILEQKSFAMNQVENLGKDRKKVDRQLSSISLNISHERYKNKENDGHLLKERYKEVLYPIKREANAFAHNNKPKKVIYFFSNSFYYFLPRSIKIFRITA